MLYILYVLGAVATSLIILEVMRRNKEPKETLSSKKVIAWSVFWPIFWIYILVK